MSKNFKFTDFNDGFLTTEDAIRKFDNGEPVFNGSTKNVYESGVQIQVFCDITSNRFSDGSDGYIPVEDDLQDIMEELPPGTIGAYDYGNEKMKSSKQILSVVVPVETPARAKEVSQTHQRLREMFDSGGLNNLKYKTVEGSMSLQDIKVMRDRYRDHNSKLRIKAKEIGNNLSKQGYPDTQIRESIANFMKEKKAVFSKYYASFKVVFTHRICKNGKFIYKNLDNRYDSGLFKYRDSNPGDKDGFLYATKKVVLTAIPLQNLEHLRYIEETFNYIIGNQKDIILGCLKSNGFILQKEMYKILSDAMVSQHKDLFSSYDPKVIRETDIKIAKITSDLK